jgi:hypothetical protein
MNRLLLMLWLLLDLEVQPDAEDDEPDADEDEDEHNGRDPAAKIAAMTGHLDRLHKKVRKQQERIEELESQRTRGDQPQLDRSTRLENAFLRAVIARNEPLDLETAWALANVRGFLDALVVGDDGTVDGMEEALARVLDRYPWLADEPYEPEEGSDGRPSRTGRPPKMRSRDTANHGQDASLIKRFPALSKKKSR